MWPGLEKVAKLSDHGLWAAVCTEQGSLGGPLHMPSSSPGGLGESPLLMLKVDFLMLWAGGL